MKPSEEHIEAGDNRAAKILFAGDSELAQLMVDKDWSKTAIGAIDQWPQSLRSALSICVGSSFPIAIYWGPELSLLYNDAWSPILGSKHPWALGHGAQEVWPEIWDVVEPGFTQVMQGGKSTYDQDSLLAMHRHGYTEECYFNFTFTPIRDESGHVGGVFNAVIETTFQVINARRGRVLRGLAEDMTGARSTSELCKTISQRFETASFDVAFSALYLIDEDEISASLVAHSGSVVGGPAAPMQILLDDEEASPWFLPSPQSGQGMKVVSDVQERFATPLHSSEWPEPVRQAMIAPIRTGAASKPSAYLIIGASPRRAIDEDYKQFTESAAAHIAGAFTTVMAYDAERKRAEGLAELDRSKTIFFSNVSHEFRTPLTLMLGPTEDLLAGQYGELSDVQREQLETIERNQLRLQKLVNTLLDFTRIESGRVEAAYASTLLGRFTADLASTFRSAIERAGIEFEIDCPVLDEAVFVDREMWEKIVLNLLSNAFKFTFTGKICISLRLEEDNAVLRVKDSGVGIEAKELPRLFERFHRIDGSAARAHEGSGIGLALVKELVKLHGGQIVGESTPGQGTILTVTIPRGRAHLPSDRIAEKNEAAEVMPQDTKPFVQDALRWVPDVASNGSSDGTEQASDPADRRKTILLVDDNADLRRYMKRLLGQRWRVQVAEDGESALRAVSESPPDLIVTDVMMPKLDGFGLLQALRQEPNTSRIPVIMLSARAGEEAKLEGLHAGADDYIVKPFSTRELLARVATRLEVANLRSVVEGERNRLENLLANAPAVVALLRGPDHIFEFANELYMVLADKRDLLGLSLREALPEVVEQGFVDLLDQVYRTGNPVTLEDHPVELLDRTGGGSVRKFFYNILYQPFRGPDGTIEGVLVFGFDVSAQVRDREQIEKAHAITEEVRLSAETAVRVRDDFLSIASHELRTPLTSLSLLVDGAQHILDGQEDLQPRLSKKITNIRRSADRLELLVNTLLDGARLAAGRLELAREPVDLGDLAHDVCERFQPEAARTGSTIHLTLAAPAVGHWDAERLDQVLTNLLSNAVRYGHGKPIYVQVDTRDENALLTVTDLGHGIDAQHQERIFERFERASSDRNFGGMGLGLWSARQVIEAMGGRISVTSQVGEGATFEVELPRDHDEH